MPQKKEKPGIIRPFVVSPMPVPHDPRAALIREAGRHTANVLQAAYGTMIWDSFAAHALQGILAAGVKGDMDRIAKDAALAADAMMEERQRRVENGRLRARKTRGGKR